MPASVAAAQGRGDDRRMGRGAAGGVRRVPGADGCRPQAATGAEAAAATSESRDLLAEIRARVSATGLRPARGRRLKFLVGKPGLDGHSNGAEQIAARARDCGMEVVYEGIRLTPEQIANAALEEGVHVVGLSILSGSHMPLIREVIDRMRALELGDIPVVAGGIIPPEDARQLLAYGVARVYTPKDFDLSRIMLDIVDLVDAGAKAA